MSIALIGGLVGVTAGIAAGFGVFIYALVQPARHCSACGESLPRFRNKPANLRQLLWGGWNCPNCNCQLDRRGQRVLA